MTSRKELALKHNLPYHVVRDAYAQGKSIDDILHSAAPEEGYSEDFAFEGKTLKEWAEALCETYSTVEMRMRRYGRPEGAYSGRYFGRRKTQRGKNGR